MKTSSENSTASNNSSRPDSQNGASANTKRKRKYPYRKVSQIEDEITTVETRIEEIHQEMMQPEVLRDGRRIKQLQEELATLEAKLLQLYEHYEEACELN